MDAGTHALDVLTGRVYPLKLGFIGVVNRSQRDIDADKCMSDALESETEFFRSHPQYRNIAVKNGTKHLAKTLNQVRALPFAFLACWRFTNESFFVFVFRCF
jgi:dynamin 1-like protein